MKFENKFTCKKCGHKFDEPQLIEIIDDTIPTCPECGYDRFEIEVRKAKEHEKK